MFSPGSVCLLVSMGLVMAFGSPITENLRQKYDFVAEALGLKDNLHEEISVLKKIIKNDSCQVMNATLQVYGQIFSTILHDNALLNDVADKQVVIKKLEELQHEMATVQRQLDDPRRNKEQLIRNLNELQVSNTDVQKTFLIHFLEIYNAARSSHRCSC